MKSRRPFVGSVLLISCVVLLGVFHGIAKSRLELGNSDDNSRSTLMEEDEDDYDFTTALISAKKKHHAALKIAQKLPSGAVASSSDVTENADTDRQDGCSHSFQCFVKLVCRNGECTYCTHDAECQETYSKNSCFFYAPGKGHCAHKTLFGHFDKSDFTIILITFLTILLSAPAGTGGGGVLVPMYIIVGKFTPHGAIPLSKATIFGGAVANNFFNLQRRHPRANRPLVDFKATVLLEPILLLGTVLGVFTNALSPGWLITILLVGTLLFVTYRTTLKGIEAYKNETERKLDVIEVAEGTTEEKQTLLMVGAGGSHMEMSHAAEVEVSIEKKALLAQMLEKEARPIWWKEVMILVLAWVIIAVSSALKGGEGAQGIVACGTFGYWVLVLLPIPIIGVITWWIARELIADHHLKEELGFRFVEGDLKWSAQNVIRYPAYCFFAGFAAGALGIAAGTVLGPVLLELGMLPIVATGSSGFMVLFTASSTTTQFLILGQLQLDYALFFAGVGIIGAAIGNTGVNYLVKKYRKTYFIIFILAGIIGTSVLLMGITGILREYQAIEQGKSVGFRPLCIASH